MVQFTKLYYLIPGIWHSQNDDAVYQAYLVYGALKTMMQFTKLIPGIRHSLPDRNSFFPVCTSL